MLQTISMSNLPPDFNSDPLGNIPRIPAFMQFIPVSKEVCLHTYNL